MTGESRKLLLQDMDEVGDIFLGNYSRVHENRNPGPSEVRIPLAGRHLGWYSSKFDGDRKSMVVGLHRGHEFFSVTRWSTVEICCE